MIAWLSSTPSGTGILSDRCRFGLFEFDFRSGELRARTEPVKLSPQPARVLALLLARPGEVVLRDELRSHLWGEDTFVDFERGLNFCILQVRGALGDSSDNPRFVQTVPRKGYRFIAPVTPSARPHVRRRRHLRPRRRSVTAPLQPIARRLGAAHAPRPRAGRRSGRGLVALVVLLAGLAWLAGALARQPSPARAGADARRRVRVSPSCRW